MIVWTFPYQALKEKTELQAQLATVNTQLQAQVEQTRASQEKQSSLATEVTSLRQNSAQLERAMVELQGNLESKNASLVSLSTDLQVAEEQYRRLMGKVEEMQQALLTKDNTGEGVDYIFHSCAKLEVDYRGTGSVAALITLFKSSCQHGHKKIDVM